MLKRLLLAALVWACVSPAFARERFWNYCQKGGQNVVTQGLQSSGEFQRTFQSCTIHVYQTGTLTLATLYSDNLSPTSTALANPFTANSDGFFEFYAAAGRYDVKETFTDTTVTPNVVYNVTWGDVYLCDGLGPNADASCTVGGAAGYHDLLSATHPDTVAFTPPGIGDMIRGSTGNLWEHFARGTDSQILAIGPGTSLPTWNNFNFYQNSLTPVNADGRLGINLIEGANITITPADDPGNDRVSYTISAASGFSGVDWLANSVAVSTETGGDFIAGDGISIVGVDNPGSSRAEFTIAQTAVGGGSQFNIPYYDGAGTTTSVIGLPGSSADPATGITFAAPTGTGVALTLTGDAHSSDIQDWNLTGGGIGASIDYLGGGHFTSLETGSGAGPGAIELFDSTVNSVTIAAPTTVTTYAATLPDAQGTGNLANDGSGNLFWSTKGVIDLTAQSADVGAATLYSVPASGAGLYRVTAYIIVTTVASTGAATSTLPSVVITWTDSDNSTSQTKTLTATNGGNLLTSYEQALMVVDAKASTTIQYSTSGYASDTASQMQYAVHIRAEKM